MKSIIVVWVLLCGALVSQAQLNYEGNPLTETIDYTAQESQSPGLNARRDYQRFEVADALKKSSPKLPFASSPIDPLITEERKHSVSGSDETVNYEKQSAPTPSETHLLEASTSTKASQTVDTRMRTAQNPATTTALKPAIEYSPKPSSLPSPDIESPVKISQLREYPIQSPIISRSMVFQGTPQRYYEPSRSVVPAEQSSITRNLSPINPQDPMPRISDQALSQFLNSRTPEESQMALDSYLTSREAASSGSGQQSLGMATEQIRLNNVNQRINLHETFDNEIAPNYENQSPQQANNVQALPVPVFPNAAEQMAYLQGATQQLHPSLGWNRIGIQSRRDNFYAAPAMRRHPLHRGPMRPRVSPFAQSRVVPGPPVYHKKGSMFAGPPGSLNSVANNHWKKPIEVIYTKPPGFAGPSQTAVGSNPPIAYEDAGKWFPDTDNPPAQKDVYYSQLYRQSYDPHYYDYIAKTGKIKPWLYGKLGKNEEKSIWWELFSGFKNHGMKNMMNPMFLLGMSIPTLTLMLTALVQKRSIARSDNGGYDARQLIEKYEPQIREGLMAYEDRWKEALEQDGTNKRRVIKRSVISGGQELREDPQFVDPASAAILDYEKKAIEQDAELDEKKHYQRNERTISPAPPGVLPFEEYFLTHQEEFAAAILAHEKQQMEQYELEKEKAKEEKKKQ